MQSARVTGKSRELGRVSDDGEEERRFHFCPECGATVYYFTDAELVAIPVGVLGEPDFPDPTVSVWESRKHAWVTLPDGVAHHHRGRGGYSTSITGNAGSASRHARRYSATPMSPVNSV